MKKPNKKSGKQKPNQSIVREVNGYEVTEINKPTLQLLEALSANPQDFETAEALIQQGADINAIFRLRDAGTSDWSYTCLLELLLDQCCDLFEDAPPADWNAAGDAILGIVRFFVTHGFDPARCKNEYHVGFKSIYALMNFTIVCYPVQAREALYLLLDAIPSKSLDAALKKGLHHSLLAVHAGAATDDDEPEFGSLMDPLIQVFAARGNRDNVDFFFTAIGKQIQCILVETPDRGPVLRHKEIEESSDGFVPAASLMNAFQETLCLALPDCYLSFSSAGELFTRKTIPLDAYTDVTDRFPEAAGQTITDITFTKAAHSEDGIWDALVHLDSGTILRFISLLEEENPETEDFMFWGNIEVLAPQTPADPE